jgi:hypothetical protein
MSGSLQSLACVRSHYHHEWRGHLGEGGVVTAGNMALCVPMAHIAVGGLYAQLVGC